MLLEPLKMMVPSCPALLGLGTLTSICLANLQANNKPAEYTSIYVSSTFGEPSIAVTFHLLRES